MESWWVIASLVLLLAHLCKTEQGLEIHVQHKPDDCYEQAANGDEVHVHYTGMLESGAVFDSSLQAGRGPLPFALGQGKVIQGWEKGILGMCVGERRKLIIPSDLAYGDKGHPPQIPPKATLIFETELVALNKAPVQDQILPLLQFLAIPAAILFGVVYLYKRYQEDSEKEKGEKKSKKKR